MQALLSFWSSKSILFTIKSGLFTNNGKHCLIFNSLSLIFKDLFLEPDEDFNLDENIEKFSKRVLIGKTYTKREIIDFGFELDEEPKNIHFLEASKILNKQFAFYEKYDKYPYSIAIQMINSLKEN